MALNYTASQVNTVNNHSVQVYANNVDLGILTNDTFNLEVSQTQEKVESSGTGTGAIRYIYGGIDEAMFSCTIESFDKNVLKTIYTELIAEGSTATNAASPFVGALELRSNPNVATEIPLVIYPIWTDEATTTSYVGDTSNLKAILFPKAVCTGSLNLSLSATEASTLELEFMAVVDTTNNNRAVIIDDGIATDGTYTP